MSRSPSALPPSAFRFAAIAASVAAIIYAPTLANELVWDDLLDITANAQVHDLHRALGYFTELHGIYWRPLVFLSFAVDHTIWTDRSFGYHLTNLLLHAINVFLVVIVACRGGLAPTVALLAGVLFATHPVQTDAVAYVSGRTDLLMTTGALLMWYALQARGSATRRGIAAAVGVCGSILSKETGYALPLFAAWWACRHEPAWGPRLRLVGPSLLAGATLLVARPGNLAWLALPLNGFTAVSRALCTAIALVVFPTGLQIDRLTSLAGSPLSGVAAVTLTLTVIAAAVWALSGRQPYADWVAWSVALYLPVANIVALYPAIAAQWLFTPEHNLYAPLAGIAVLIAAGVVSMAERTRAWYGRLAVACAATLLLVYATVTVLRLRDWHDEARLFRTAVAAGSTSPRVWYNHANMLVRGDALAAGVDAYHRALALAPHDVAAWTNLGVALQRQGALDAAIDAYTRAAALAPPSALLLENLGTAQLRAGDVNEARASFTRALALDPQRVTSRQALAAIDHAVEPR